MTQALGCRSEIRPDIPHHTMAECRGYGSRRDLGLLLILLFLLGGLFLRGSRSGGGSGGGPFGSPNGASPSFHRSEAFNRSIRSARVRTLRPRTRLRWTRRLLSIVMVFTLLNRNASIVGIRHPPRDVAGMVASLPAGGVRLGVARGV
jgi:hypothetical protein